MIIEDREDRMRRALEDCLTFLEDKPWGSISYMEGSQVYRDIAALTQIVRAALSDEAAGLGR